MGSYHNTHACGSLSTNGKVALQYQGLQIRPIAILAQDQQHEKTGKLQEKEKQHQLV